MFPVPVVFASNVLDPIALFPEAVFKSKELNPIAVQSEPVIIAPRESVPIAVFPVPVVFASNVLDPIALFPEAVFKSKELNPIAVQSEPVTIAPREAVPIAWVQRQIFAPIVFHIGRVVFRQETHIGFYHLPYQYVENQSPSKPFGDLILFFRGGFFGQLGGD